MGQSNTLTMEYHVSVSRKRTESFIKIMLSSFTVEPAIIIVQRIFHLGKELDHCSFCFACLCFRGKSSSINFACFYQGEEEVDVVRPSRKGNVVDSPSGIGSTIGLAFSAS